MPRFAVESLRPLGEAILVAAGTTPEEASLVIDHACDALLSGETNHGMELGTQYIAAIQKGTLRPGTPFTVVRETPTTLMVDGGMNLGHYVSHHAMTRLIDKARSHHVAAASIRYQGHVGRLIDYTSMASRAGMVALMMCDGAWGPKFMAPYGGADRRLGVNPFSLTVPGPDGGVVGFDMTAGTVSMMKVFRAHAEGRGIPEGWIVDSRGRPTTDPGDFMAGGSTLPFGGVQAHKGYVITFMIEVLADVLSGMEFKEDLTRPWPIIDGCFMAVFDVEAFRPLVDFRRDLAAFIEYVKSSRLAEGSQGVFYPGERSAMSRQRRSVEGVVIPDDVWDTIAARAREFGVHQLVPQPVALA